MAVLMSLTAACGGGSSDDAAPSPDTSATESTAAESGAATTLRPGATAGFDDLNQDGEPDPTCGTRDFGAGLVLTIPCDASGYSSEPSEGVVLVPDSLRGLPSINDQLSSDILSNVSSTAVAARDENGKQVYVFFIQSDTLFDTGASTLSDPARETLAGLAQGIQRNWPTAPIQVRGHTDATGSASANQTLSEQRATNVADYLASQGIDQSRLSAIGLGSTRPIALETNPDGSESAAGQTENRRVELVVRVP
jgi:outer membrane protein OmpA-like peptidoglycan-associated protein